MVDAIAQANRNGFSLGAAADQEGRRLFLVGEVNESMLYRFMVAFSVMDSTPGDITIMLSSNGGEETSGYAIYDLIRSSHNHVTIEGFGGVQSIAALILQAADVRKLSHECRFMVHNGSVTMGDEIDSDTLVAIGQEVDQANRNYQRILAKRSGQKLARVREWCQSETYFGAADAVRMNLADYLILPRKKR